MIYTMRMKTTWQFLGVGIGAATLLAAGLFLWQDGRVAFLSNIPVPDQASSSNVLPFENQQQGSGYTIELVGPARPLLTHSLVITSNLSETAKAELRTKVEQTKKDLQTEPERADLWLSLGLYYKTAGDYSAAEEVWKYVAEITSNYIVLGNLADLYMNFIKDYPKAENYYRQALQIKPTEIDFYRNLYTLYRYLYKTDTNAAQEVLELGLKNNPGNSELQALLEEYNKTHAQ